MIPIKLAARQVKRGIGADSLVTVCMKALVKQAFQCVRGGGGRKYSNLRKKLMNSRLLTTICQTIDLKKNDKFLLLIDILSGYG